MQAAPSAVELYRPFPHQDRFHTSPARFRLIGGAAGPGKSEAVLQEAVMQCLELPKVDGIVFRRSFPELEMSLIQRFLEKIPNHLYDYNTSKHIATFVNGSTLRFGYCENEKDVYRYQSAEFDFEGVDELTHFSEYFFTYIISRLRSTKPGVWPNFFAGTNPGNIGHEWVKSRWVDKNCDDPGYNPNDYDFTPARVYDNPVLMKIDPDYVKRLENLPDTDRRALLDGDWDIFAGQYFSEFRKSVHVATPLMLSSSWSKYIWIDYGSTSPFAAYWPAVDFDGHVWAYREYYVRGKTARENATAIWELSQADPINPQTGQRYERIVIDRQVFQKQGNDLTIAEVIQKTWHELDLEASRTNPNHVWMPSLVGSGSSQKIGRIAGWNILREYLRHGPSMPPKIHFYPTCTNLIRTIPLAIHDEPDNVEDLILDDDHGIEAIRIGLVDLHERKSTPPPTQIELKMRAFKQRFEPENRYSDFYAA